jgi:hypothetical protein
MYEDSTLTHLWPRSLYQFGSQLAVDHMLGHLYEYQRGADDWGEAAASRWQFRLLRHRGGLAGNLAAVLMALTTRFHKKISLSNYR